MGRLQRIIFGKNPRRTSVRILVLAAASVVAFRWLLLPIRAEGVSMLPTYRSGTLNLVNRMAYVMGRPARGDVVAIRLAGLSVVYVKRVIGLPGERVAIVDGQVRINGRPLAEPYVTYQREWDLPEVRVGPHEYFVIGDNRGASDYGSVDESRIVGKVLF